MPALEIGRHEKPAATSNFYVFAVRAAQDPQVMLRVAGLFAQRHIVPHQLSCRTSGSSLLIDVEVALAAPEIARLLLEKIRSIVCVERANLVEGKV